MRPLERDDIRHPIAIDHGSGRLAAEQDEALHVEQMMMQVLMTAPGERPHRPEFGCGIRRLVFAPNSEVSAHLLKITIFRALDRWLGELVKVDDVVVRTSEETLEVHVVYALKSQHERRYLDLRVTR